MVIPSEILTAQASSSSLPLVLCTVLVFFHGMTDGGSLGYSGLVLPHHTNNSSALLHLTEEEGACFVSISPLAISVGTLLSIPAAELLGRKMIFLVSNVVCLLSCLALYLAPSFPVLALARATLSLGQGLTAMIAGVYLAEISTVQGRGPVSGVFMTSGVVGLLAYTALCIVIPIQFLCLIMAGHNLVLFLLVLLLPESPQWLVRHGRQQEAKDSLNRLRGGSYSGLKVEMEEIRQCVEETKSKDSFCQALTNKAFKIPFLIFTVIFFLVACCGCDTMVYYGPTIFSRLDLGLPSAQLSTLPWVGFSVGYAVSGVLMARSVRGCTL